MCLGLLFPKHWLRLFISNPLVYVSSLGGLYFLDFISLCLWTLVASGLIAVMLVAQLEAGRSLHDYRELLFHYFIHQAEHFRCV